MVFSHQIFTWDTEKICIPMGTSLQLTMSHGGISKNGFPPQEIFMCDTEKVSHSMGIRLRTDYFTWRSMEPWIPPTSNPHLGQRNNFQSYGYKVTLETHVKRNIFDIWPKTNP